MENNKEQEFAQVVIEENDPQVIVEEPVKLVEKVEVEESEEASTETETSMNETETINSVVSADATDAPSEERVETADDGATDIEDINDASEQVDEESISGDVMLDETNEIDETEEVSEQIQEFGPVVEEETAPIEAKGELKEVQIDKVNEVVTKESEPKETPTAVEPPDANAKNNVKVYPRNPELESILQATCKTMKQLEHVTNCRAKSKNNKHWTLTIESNLIENLFLHGINMSFFKKKGLLEALQLIMNHWNDNLGVLPDNCFMICFMRLLLDEHSRKSTPKASSMMCNDDIRKKVIAHYMSSRYEWTWRSILPALEFADACESKSRWIDSQFKTRVRIGQQWTPYLEDMEAYFNIADDPFADIDVPEEERLREVGMTLRNLQIRNPRIVGHLVKINAMRKRMLEERAEKIQQGKIDLSSQTIDVSKIDTSDLQSALMSSN